MNVGIYIDSAYSEFISLAIQYLKKTRGVVEPHIFSDGRISSYIDMACLSSFYMRFYRDSLLFTNLEDFLSNQYDVISNDIYVMVLKKELESNYINKNSIKNVKFLTFDDNGEIHEI